MTAMHPGLLAAVLERPGDDTPRLILADWLDESGDPSRSEFIRVQVELAKVGGTTYTQWADGGGPNECAHGIAAGLTCGECIAEPLRRRERELLNDHGLSEWVPDGWEGWVEGRQSFRRGFIEAVRLPCADWLAHGPAIVRAQPVTRVMLSDHTCVVWPDGSAHLRFAQLAGCPELFRPRVAAELRALSYPSEGEALDALSRRCLAWAKGESTPTTEVP